MKLRSFLLYIISAFFVFVTQNSFAAGPHDMNCQECHSPHLAKGDYLIGVEPGSLENPATTRLNKTTIGIDALCLGCHHADGDNTPIHLNSTHPTSITPTYVTVPSDLVRNNEFGCISCHNPHPSNPNYKYLIVPTNDGTDMGRFCGVCHGEQSAPEVLKMVQTNYNIDPAEEPRVKISK